MRIEDRVLRDGFEIQSSRHREIVEDLADDGFCEIREQEVCVCSHCGENIPLEDFQTAEIECPRCEWMVDQNKTEIRNISQVQVDRSNVYSTLRDQFKSATGLPHGTKNSIGYREYDVEYRFLLQDRQSETHFRAQILFESPSETMIECLRLFSYPILTILADAAVSKKERFESYDIPHRTLGQMATASDEEIRDALSEGDQDTQLAHIDDRVRIANEWCTTRSHLEAMSWYEFEYAVQAFLDKLFIKSRLLGGTAAGEEVPDGVMGFTIDGKNYRYFWDAKFVEFDSTDANELRSSPHVPMSENEAHSMSDEYRKVADHAHRYMSDQGIDLDGVVLFSPRIPETQIEKVQQKLKQFEHRRSWSGKTIYFTLDALIELYQGVNEDRGGASNKWGFLMRAIVDYLEDDDLHEDPEDIKNADGVIKFGVDDVKKIFAEIETTPTEHEMPSYEVYVSRSRNT